jgi:hypothetical protein
MEGTAELDLIRELAYDVSAITLREFLAYRPKPKARRLVEDLH